MHQEEQTAPKCTNQMQIAQTTQTIQVERPENLSEIRQKAPNPGNTAPADCNLA